MKAPAFEPAWPGYFADPFVLRSGGEYYAYGTAESLEHAPDGAAGAFKVLHSTDLKTWAVLGCALKVPPERATHAYWAPEVAASRGRYHLYYSRAPGGEDEKHRVFGAVADAPDGPFHEVGPVFCDDVGFCIDAHPFCDPRDGSWYLFFARDFFDDRAGTGIAVVRLAEDLLSVQGEPAPVVRANHDWQIYQRERPLYGRTWPAWHTVEGPCVVARAGRYFCFYSGGNWQTENYGISYAVADHPLGPWRHAAMHGPVVLRQIPDELVGPGHNSVTTTPSGDDIMVFHAWDRGHTARRMFIAPLRWPHGLPEGDLRR